MKKNVFVSVLIVLLGFIIPILTQNYFKNSFQIGLIQLGVLLAVLISGLILIIYNHIIRQNNVTVKISSLVFEFLGYLGVITSLIILYFIFAFRSGISF